MRNALLVRTREQKCLPSLPSLHPNCGLFVLMCEVARVNNGHSSNSSKVAVVACARVKFGFLFLAAEGLSLDEIQIERQNMVLS